ncbi:MULTISPECIES: hypothetical protein [unclassified Microcoleus]|uniref:hypothetical protein n=1 Tax=unclassified Microcoleus TaxID=2642155 RepID=UPI002FD35D3D
MSLENATGRSRSAIATTVVGAWKKSDRDIQALFIWYINLKKASLWKKSQIYLRKHLNSNLSKNTIDNE